MSLPLSEDDIKFLRKVRDEQIRIRGEIDAGRLVRFYPPVPILEVPTARLDNGPRDR